MTAQTKIRNNDSKESTPSTSVVEHEPIFTKSKTLFERPDDRNHWIFSEDNSSVGKNHKIGPKTLADRDVQNTADASLQADKQCLEVPWDLRDRLIRETVSYLQSAEFVAPEGEPKIDYSRAIECQMRDMMAADPSCFNNPFFEAIMINMESALRKEIPQFRLEKSLDVNIENTLNSVERGKALFKIMCAAVQSQNNEFYKECFGNAEAANFVKNDSDIKENDEHLRNGDQPLRSTESKSNLIATHSNTFKPNSSLPSLKNEEMDPKDIFSFISNFKCYESRTAQQQTPTPEGEDIILPEPWSLSSALLDEINVDQALDDLINTEKYTKTDQTDPQQQVILRPKNFLEAALYFSTVTASTVDLVMDLPPDRFFAPPLLFNPNPATNVDWLQKLGSEKIRMDLRLSGIQQKTAGLFAVALLQMAQHWKPHPETPSASPHGCYPLLKSNFFKRSIGIYAIALVDHLPPINNNTMNQKETMLGRMAVHSNAERALRSGTAHANKRLEMADLHVPSGAQLVKFWTNLGVAKRLEILYRERRALLSGWVSQRRIWCTCRQCRLRVSHVGDTFELFYRIYLADIDEQIAQLSCLVVEKSSKSPESGQCKNETQEKEKEINSLKKHLYRLLYVLAADIADDRGSYLATLLRRLGRAFEPLVGNQKSIDYESHHYKFENDGHEKNSSQSHNVCYCPTHGHRSVRRRPNFTPSIGSYLDSDSSLHSRAASVDNCTQIIDDRIPKNDALNNFDDDDYDDDYDDDFDEDEDEEMDDSFYEDFNSVEDEEVIGNEASLPIDPAHLSTAFPRLYYSAHLDLLSTTGTARPSDRQILSEGRELYHSLASILFQFHVVPAFLSAEAVARQQRLLAELEQELINDVNETFVPKTGKKSTKKGKKVAPQSVAKKEVRPISNTSEKTDPSHDDEKDTQYKNSVQLSHSNQYKDDENSLDQITKIQVIYEISDSIITDNIKDDPLEIILPNKDSEEQPTFLSPSVSLISIDVVSTDDENKSLENVDLSHVSTGENPQKSYRDPVIKPDVDSGDLPPGISLLNFENSYDRTPINPTITTSLEYEFTGQKQFVNDDSKTDSATIDNDLDKKLQFRKPLDELKSKDYSANLKDLDMDHSLPPGIVPSTQFENKKTVELPQDVPTGWFDKILGSAMGSLWSPLAVRHSVHLEVEMLESAFMHQPPESITSLLGPQKRTIIKPPISANYQLPPGFK